MELKEVFEPLVNFLKNFQRKDKEISVSKDKAKERLQLVLMQDRASVSPDFFEMMKKELIEVIKKYIEIDEEQLEVQLTRGYEDGNGIGPALLANIPIKNIKPVAKKTVEKEETVQEVVEETAEEVVEEEKDENIDTIETTEEATTESEEETVEEDKEDTIDTVTVEETNTENQDKKKEKTEEKEKSANIDEVNEGAYTVPQDIDKEAEAEVENPRLSPNVRIEKRDFKTKLDEVKTGVSKNISKVKAQAKDGIKKIKSKVKAKN